MKMIDQNNGLPDKKVFTILGTLALASAVLVGGYTALFGPKRINNPRQLAYSTQAQTQYTTEYAPQESKNVATSLVKKDITSKLQEPQLEIVPVNLTSQYSEPIQSAQAIESVKTDEELVDLRNMQKQELSDKVARVSVPVRTAEYNTSKPVQVTETHLPVLGAPVRILGHALPPYGHHRVMPGPMFMPRPAYGYNGFAPGFAPMHMPGFYGQMPVAMPGAAWMRVQPNYRCGRPIANFFKFLFVPRRYVPVTGMPMVVQQPVAVPGAVYYPPTCQQVQQMQMPPACEQIQQMQPQYQYDQFNQPIPQHPLPPQPNQREF